MSKSHPNLLRDDVVERVLEIFRDNQIDAVAIALNRDHRSKTDKVDYTLRTPIHTLDPAAQDVVLDTVAVVDATDTPLTPRDVLRELAVACRRSAEGTDILHKFMIDPPLLRGWRAAKAHVYDAGMGSHFAHANNPRQHNGCVVDFDLMPDQPHEWSSSEEDT